MTKPKTKTIKKPIIDKKKLFAEAVKNSIKVHGILLEYETKKLFTHSLEKIGFHIKESIRSHYLRWNDQECEIDVFVEAVNKLEFLDDIYKDNELQEVNHRLSMYTYYLVQCKGHDKEGFLLANSCESPKEFELPIYKYKEDYKDSPELVKKIHPKQNDIYFVDWAYFYTGEMQDWNTKHKINTDKLENLSGKFPVFKQDKVSNSNKFLRAIEQINESLDCFIGGAKPFCNQSDMTQLIIPVIVTNAQIFIMEHNDNKVTVYNNIPWFVYVNKQKWQSKFSHLPVYDKFFVINTLYIPEFCSVMQSFIMENNFQYEIKGKSIITKFDV
jgi:hypothetical protein